MGTTPVNYMRIEPFWPQDDYRTLTTTACTDGWSMSEEPKMWTHTAQELMDKYWFARNKIEEALGPKYYVKKNMLYRS